MAIEDGGAAPYAPPSAILGVIETYRERGMQNPFTLEVLMKAGVTEGLAPRTLQALKLLDLVDDKGEPKEILEGLRRAPSDEFAARLEAVVRSAYGPIFQFADPAKDAPERIRDAFRGYSPPSQQLRMVTLFMGLCEKARIVEARPRKAAATGEARRPSRVFSAPRSKSPKGEREPYRPSGKIPGPIEALMHELPGQGESWTQNQHDEFITALKALLKFSFPIKPSAQNGGNEHKGGESE